MGAETLEKVLLKHKTIPFRRYLTIIWWARSMDYYR